MSKRFTHRELEALEADLNAEATEIHAADGARNAALHWSRVVTAARFACAPHAHPEPVSLTDALERVGAAFRVADSYRVVYGVALTDLNTADARTIDYAHRAAAQYTAALEQLTGAVSDARVALYSLLPVMPA